jgi:hypothetical protein
MPIDITDPDLSPMDWATSLDGDQLAAQLDTLANDWHRLAADERRAVLLVARDSIKAHMS